MRNLRTTHRQGGFTLIEALTALIIMAFGLLSIAGVQLHLSRSADVAKQRTEATRLAQERIERYRSFTSVPSWNALPASGVEPIAGLTYSGSASQSTNTSYTLTYALSGASSDVLRALNVTVSWRDRVNDEQSVSLTSVISKTDPADSGKLTFPQNRAALGAGNVSAKLPRTAIKISSSQSKLQLAPGNTLVFNNITGAVTHSCTGTVGTEITVASGCSEQSASILTGYVSGSVSLTSPTGVTISSLSGNSGSAVCSYQQATVDGTAISGYYYYVCAIPVASGGSWSGTPRLTGVSILGNYKVCRFFQTGTNDTYSYSAVTSALTNQNYFIEDSNNNSCPTLTSDGGTIENGGSIATKLQQNCRFNNVNAATECPAL